ncbi:MAG: hypothetical protein J7639_25835 [Paenibacillaceae bacterium]|nr:hypothetical protein [Paenibacillaceae bacterium]
MKPAYSTGLVPIDINLLPQRTSSVHVPLVPAAMIVLAACASVAFGWLWSHEQQRQAEAKERLAEITRSVASLQTNATKPGATGKWTEQLALPAALRQAKPVVSELFDKLNKLLPLYANVTQLDMNNQGALNTTVQFARSEDIVSFSRALQVSDRFQLAKMGAINNLANAASVKSQPAAAPTLPVYQVTFEMIIVPAGTKG